MDPAATRRVLMRTSLPGNLIGAIVTFAYFRFVDYGALRLEGPLSAGEIVYFAVFFSLLVLSGIQLVSRWHRPLVAPPPAGPAGDLVRRRALQVPYTMAGSAATGWALAGA